MPDSLAQALALPGLGWLVAAAFTAGLVRGFAGFGTAMIYLPVAGQVLPPFWALVSLVVMDAFGPLFNLRKAWRDVHPPDLLRLALGTALTLPVGLALLAAAEPGVFRYVVSALALVLLACLISGLRYHGPMGPRLIFGTGLISGLSGGFAGIPGPPVILLYMASPLPSHMVRAVTTLHLFSYDLMMLVMIGLQGRLSGVPLVVGLILAVPVMLGNLAGAAIFRPGAERTYRGVAYLVIAVSALSGLPLWD